MTALRDCRLWLLALCVVGASLGSMRPAAAVLGNIIRWDPVRNVWVDAKTKGVVTVSSNSVTQPTGVAPAAFTQQGTTRPQRPSNREFFPLVIPDAEWWKTCDKNASDFLTMVTTKCDIFKDIVNCQQLAEMGYLPAGVQSFVPSNLHGGFTIPNGCSSGNLGIEYDGWRMTFNSPQVPIMAVIGKDLISKVFYFGSGVTQGSLLKLLMKKAEFCYAPPSMSPLYVSKTASFSTGMQPGSASWNFYKTATLASPFTSNIATMLRGDTVDATWTLQVQKTGTDTVYQGAVTGQITITNPQAVPVTVYNINDYVQGGPSSTVSCGATLPFTIQPCSSTVCNYVGYWPLAPAAGTYTNLADVSYSVGTTGTIGNQVGTSVFQVGSISPALGMMSTPSGQQIPAGQAVVSDAMAPQQYFFSGSTTQQYTTALTCPESGIVTNQATLVAATGQQVQQTATVQKLCYDLQVRVAQAASPFVGRWGWNVTKTADKQRLELKPSATAWDKYVKQQMDLAIASGQDPNAAMALISGGANTTHLSAATMEGSMTGEVTYTVTFTRQPPGGIVAGAPAFQTVGDVFITNTSPLNAALKEVTVSISNPFGGVAYTVAASCPMLTVSAGQTLQCRYIATPSFNPIGAQVVGTAHYLNVRNGVPTGSTTAFTSASNTLGGATGGDSPGDDAAAPEPAPVPVPGTVPPAEQPAASRKLLAAAGGIQERLEGLLKMPNISLALQGHPDIAKALSGLVNTPGSDSDVLAALTKLLPGLPKLPGLPRVTNVSAAITVDGGDKALPGGGKETTVVAGTNGTKLIKVTDEMGGLSKLLTGITNLVEGPFKPHSKISIASNEVMEPLPGQEELLAQLEAPAAAAAPAAANGSTIVASAGPPAKSLDFQGLQDECIDIKDVFAAGADYTTGMIVAGSIPSGRICESATFTYTVRYGPYAECFEKKALNKASFKSGDNSLVGEDTSQITVKVKGCGPSVTATAKSYAVWAKKTFAWTVTKSIDKPVLSLAQGQAGTATYKVAYERKPLMVNPKLSVTVQFDNLTPAKAVSLDSFSYTVQSTCPAGTKEKSGTFTCDTSTIPAGGAPLACKIKVDLPCAGPGVLVAHASAGNKAVHSTPFSFPTPEIKDTLDDSECAIVVDEFRSGPELAQGQVTAGTRPYGKLCGSKEFEYTASFGPYDKCARKKAINTASLKTGLPTEEAKAVSTLLVDVGGCDVYTPMDDNSTAYNATVVAAVATPTFATPLPVPSEPAETALATPTVVATAQPVAVAEPAQAPAAGKDASQPRNCVSPIEFWKQCMLKGNPSGKCAIVLKLPAGPHSAFFPQPNERATRTYKAVMEASAALAPKAVGMWYKAAQALIGAQLNELAGVVLPKHVRDAVSLVGSVVGSAHTQPPSVNVQLPGLPSAISTLESFAAGKEGVLQC